MSGTSTDSPNVLAGRKRARCKDKDLLLEPTFASLAEAVTKTVKDAANEGSGPMDTLMKLKEERKAAKAKSAETTRQMKACAKKVARLQEWAKKLTDDGLLVEYARRQALKEKQKEAASARD